MSTLRHLITSCLPVALLLGCGSSSGVSTAPANECEKLLAHVEQLPGYWDGLSRPMDEGDSPDRKVGPDKERAMEHFSHHVTFLRGCAKLDEEQSACITKASTWVQYQACNVSDALRQGSEESFKEVFAKRSEATVESGADGVADCEKMTRHTLVLATRFLPSETKKKFTAAMEPEMEKSAEKCKREAPSKKLETCVLGAKNLASSTECQMLIAKARKREDKRGDDRGSDNQPTGAEAALGELEQLADEMCACKDNACAELVSEKMTSFSKRHNDTKPDEAMMDRVNAAASRLGTCQLELMSQQ
ncbi:MAG TPA: hypothetical protein VML75_17875 [Kofleriaceae bacterium]|nr:hypothetical protein [Kofleriaceae bacterium]